MTMNRPEHPRTRWLIRSSSGLDALCLLNLLTGEEFYTRYRPGEAELWLSRLNPEALEALRRLIGEIRDERHLIISAVLCLTVSTQRTDSLADVQQALGRPDLLKVALLETPYFEEVWWQAFEHSRTDLQIVLQNLADEGYERHWTSTIEPAVQHAVEHFRETLNHYDVVSEVEVQLGRRIDDDTVEAIVLGLTAPHGMKLADNQFITAAHWSPETTVLVAAHELMHPPYDLGLAEIREAVNALQEDAFLKARFDHHDPTYGYNTWEGFVEEGCVRALDQTVCERLGVARPAWSRFSTEDGGMHALAALMHALLQAREDHTESFGAFFARQVKNGALQPGTLAEHYARLERQAIAAEATVQTPPAPEKGDHAP